MCVFSTCLILYFDLFFFPNTNQTDLDIDWNGSPINYTCYHRIPYGIDTGIDSIVECEKLSSDYMVN